jgi:hypothetical protein
MTPTMPLNLEMPPTSGAFMADEDAKAMQIKAGRPTKTVKIGTNLDPK